MEDLYEVYDRVLVVPVIQRLLSQLTDDGEMLLETTKSAIEHLLLSDLKSKPVEEQV